MRIGLGSIGPLVVLAVTSVLAPRPATACSACDNDRCIAVFEQGASGCSEGEPPCSLIQRLTVGCQARWCSTAGFPACNTGRPETPSPVEPIKASSAQEPHPKPATPVLPEGAVAEALTCGTAPASPLAAQHD